MRVIIASLLNTKVFCERFDGEPLVGSHSAVFVVQHYSNCSGASAVTVVVSSAVIVAARVV